MTIRVLHYSDIENAYDDPERVGRLAGTIDALRDGRTVVVGTGDNTAPGVLAMQTEGRQALDFFRAVAPDFETFGNHDFDFGTEPLREILRKSPQRWITANLYPADADPGGSGENGTTPAETDHRRFADADPTAVVEVGDGDAERDSERVGFVGVTDPRTPDIAAGASELSATDPVAAVRGALGDLRERTDHVVVLAHLRAETENAVARLDGVDAVLGGHVHSERRDRIDGTLVVRPGANGRVVWEVELGSGESDGATATRRAVADYPRDDRVADALRDRMDATGLTEVVCTVAEPIPRTRDRRLGGECRVANLVTDAYRWATGADVAYTQSGGLRDGDPLAGDVTVADLVGVSPFGGELQTAVVPGARLRELVETVFTPDDERGRLWAGHFAGLEVVYDTAEAELREVRFDGKPVTPDEDYSVATNAYVVEYGSEPIRPDDVVESFGVQYDAIVEYAREEGLDVRLDGRLTRV
ncbi:bifunctional UDP-sugar hydrolase/5'-nucleotidase [Halorussus sp. MSC15.2]|uniref:bifunctional metallophosphatase/5'-nucleotidase n=1 Tax=Halorussus sp. MSC15.2 TaxID=2283638 RepID=UPI0013D1EFE0|nr:bifunctional metallophosphatase/5'-nucleotidase [Halorussus sp. MSC15.2]NEU57284.1 bifunctional metallophosphatase/5'-nucleotidase [Halorussus sp. MSC15.2]